MAVKKKVKAKAKRKKAPVKRPVMRRKIAKRTKKPARKAPVRRAAPKAAKPKAAKPKLARSRPAKAKPPSLPAQPLPGVRVGVVTHYYGQPSVAIVKLESGSLRVGDTIHFKGHTSDFSQCIESLQVEHAAVGEVGPNDDFGIKVLQHVREHDVVYKVAS